MAEKWTACRLSFSGGAGISNNKKIKIPSETRSLRGTPKQSQAMTYNSNEIATLSLNTKKTRKDRLYNKEDKKILPQMYVIS
jgi:hypothetical protein